MFGMVFTVYVTNDEPCHASRFVMCGTRYTTIGGSNGIVLALDLDDPSECPELEGGEEQVRPPVLSVKNRP